MSGSRGGWFITGTDTGIGKTIFATNLCRALRTRGHKVAVMKPVATGAVHTLKGWRNDDAEALIEASGVDWPYGEVNPYCFEPPVSPHLAAAEAGVDVDLAHIAALARRFREQADTLIVEAAGGWRAPISASKSMSDLAQAIELPVILVVGIRLGCLNHASLSWEAIQRSRLRCAGWVANRIDPDMLRPTQNVHTLSALLGEPPLADLTFGFDHHHSVGILQSCIDRLAVATGSP